MTRELILRSGRTQRIVFSIAIAVFGMLFTPCAKAQTTIWKIQLDVTGPNLKPVYCLLSPVPQPAKQRCKFANPNQASSAESLQFCPDDTVNWSLKTNSGHIELFLYHKDAVLINDEFDPAHGFHASNKDTVGGDVSEDAAADADHKYYVVVFDKDNSKTYYDDPKIIIGSGGPIEMGKLNKDADKLEKQARELRRNAEHLKNSVRDKTAVEAQAKKILDDVQNLRKILQ
jgi:hypothetical protein